MIKRIITYSLKLIVSNLFCYLGGVYFLKFIFRNRPVLAVLNYHNFSCFNNYKIKRGDILKSADPLLFENQIIKLKRHFHFTTPQDFFAGKCKNGINLFLTFDDGYRDNFDLAFPILTKYSIPAAFFISTSKLDSDDFLLHDKVRYLVQRNLLDSEYAKIPLNMYKGDKNYSEEFISYINSVFIKNNPNHRLMMTSSEIKTLFDSGFIIGNHTHNHIGLTFLDKENQRDEIEVCSAKIEKIVSRKVSHFAYPNGLYNDDTISVLRDLSFDFGYSVNGGVNTTHENKHLIKRIGINITDSYSTIVHKIFLFSILLKNKKKIL